LKKQTIRKRIHCFKGNDMTEEIKNVNAKVDELEAAAKKYASKDTVISIGGYEFTPAKLMVAFTLVSSTLGGLYGAFEVYKDYQGMKKKIAEYSAPDLSGFDKRLAVIEENSAKTSDYTRDIKTDLKNDLRRNESVTEQVERSVKTAQRETEQEMRDMRKAVREDLEKARNEANTIRKEMADARQEITREVIALKRETSKEVEVLKREVDNKIQKAIDNPLANK
jgi:dsDNA-specific endonuclease/ATPase MutS2